MGRNPSIVQITVVMPALNEAKNIGPAVASVFKAFRKCRIGGELIVVDDGSRDETPRKLREARKKFPDLQILRHEHPSGPGGAFLAGVRRARGQAVVMIPGDNENRPIDILQFLGLLDQVDIIAPFVHNAELRNRWRRFVSALYRFIISFCFGTTLNYYNGTVVYRTRLLRRLQIRSQGFFYQTEILIRALRRGALFAEVPVFLQTRGHGRSKALSLKNLASVIGDFLRLFWEIHFARVEARSRAGDQP